MRFALSTHLFHGARLSRAHLETIKAAGFADIEVFATSTHIDYRSEREIDQLAGWLKELGLTAGSMHAPICASFVNGEWGRAFSNASSDASHRTEAVAETSRAMQAARALGCEFEVLHLGLPRGQTIPPGDNDRRAAQRSLGRSPRPPARPVSDSPSSDSERVGSTADALLDWIDGELDLHDAGICLISGHAHLLGGAPEAGGAVGARNHHARARQPRPERRSPGAVPGTIDWPTTLASLWLATTAGWCSRWPTPATRRKCWR